MDTPSRPAKDTLDSRKAHDRMHRSRIEEHWQVFSVYKVDQTALQWSMAREGRARLVIRTTFEEACTHECYQ